MTPSPRAGVLGQLQGIKGVFVKIVPLRSQSLQSFPLDTFPLPAEAKQCRFWPSFPESGRGKSGGAGFGQRPRRSGRGKSGGAGFSQRPRRAARGSQAVQVLAGVPGKLPGESQTVQVLAVVPGGAGGESQAVQVSAVVPGGAGGLPEDSGGRPNQSFLPPKTINPAEIVASTIMMYLILSANPQTWSYLNS